MSNKISRTVCITHSMNGLSVRFFRWNYDTLPYTLMTSKTYRPKSGKIGAMLDLFLSLNPPSLTHVHFDEYMLILNFHYSTFYEDAATRKKNLIRFHKANMDASFNAGRVSA